MGYTKEKQAKRKKQNPISFYSSFKSKWVQKSPVLFFVCGFGFLLAIFYFFWQSAFFNAKIQPVIVSVNATLSSIILNLLGQGTSASNEVITSANYSISISRGCDAIEAMALFLATTLAFPMNWSSKIRGVILGMLLLFVLNLIRIVTLFFFGAYFPSTFEMMHVQVWPVIIIIFATALWIFLIRADLKKKAHAKN